MNFFVQFNTKKPFTFKKFMKNNDNIKNKIEFLS